MERPCFGTPRRGDASACRAMKSAARTNSTRGSRKLPRWRSRVIGSAIAVMNLTKRLRSRQGLRNQHVVRPARGPNPYKEHVTFHEFLKKVGSMPAELGGANIFFVEDVAYQKAAIQEMERALLPVVPMKPTTDKRSRLQVVAPYIKNGTVLFPRTGCEELLGQNFQPGC